MAITVKKSPAWVPGQGMTLSGTGPGMVVQSFGGGGGGGGGSRPLIDANHVHVWNCDETSGAYLVDSVGGKNLALQGSAGTDHVLGQYVTGDAVPFLRCLNDGQNYVVAQSTDMNFSSATVTLECVVRMTALPEFPSETRTTMTFDNGNQYLFTAIEDSRPTAAIYGRKAYGGQYTSSGWPPFGRTSVTEYLSGFDTQSNATYADSGTTTVAVNSTYHIMYAFDSTASEANRHKFYINGTLVSITQMFGMGDAMSGLTNFALGGQSGQTRSSQCYIRDVRISNITRDATYAAAAYAALV